MSAIVITGEQNIRNVRILALRSALRLEVKGLRLSRGRSAYKMIKDEFGFKGNKETVLAQLDIYIALNILPEEPATV